LAVGFALEQTLHVVALAVFSYVDFSRDQKLNVMFITLENVEIQTKITK
jgi:hypothetical protein